MRFAGVAVATVVAVMVAAGCGGGGSEGADSAEPSETTSSASSTPSESATPTPTPSAAPVKVSMATSCKLLFGDGRPTLDVMISFISRRSNSVKQAQATQDAIDETREIAARAPTELEVQLNVVADETQAFLDDAYDPAAGARDTTAMRTAGYEVAQICQGNMF